MLCASDSISNSLRSVLRISLCENKYKPQKNAGSTGNNELLLKTKEDKITSKFYRSVVLNGYLFSCLKFVHECYYESGKGGQNVGERRNIDFLFEVCS